MGEDIINDIVKFLSKTDERMSIKELYEALRKKGFDYSHATILKWVEVGIAQGRIKEKDYGNVRILWVEKEAK